MEEKKVYLAILNITSWAGQCSDATHVYGKLILSTNSKVTIDNVEEWNVNYLGEKIEITQAMTLKIAKKLDMIDGGKTYQRSFMLRDVICDDEDFDEFLNTRRFDSIEEVVNAGIAKWRELGLDCPFISLYDGSKYKSNSHNPSSTIILQFGE